MMNKFLTALVAVALVASIAFSTVIFAADKKPTVTQLEDQDEVVTGFKALYKAPFKVFKVETEKTVAVYLPVAYDEVGSIHLWTKDSTRKAVYKEFEDGVAVMAEEGYLLVFDKQPRELGVITVIDEPKETEKAKPTEETKPTETKPVESKSQKDQVPNTGAYQ